MNEPSDTTLTETSDALKGIMMPVQPKLVSEILSAYPNIDDISRIIQRDPALSASIFKLAHNPCFELPRQSSIKDAVTTLGAHRVIMLINASLLRMAGNAEFNREALSDFWETSQQVAEIAALSSRHLNIDLVDEAYCVGIFHHIGMPLMWQKHPEYFDHIQGFSGQRLVAHENHLFKSDHSNVGYFIAKSIRLDQSICEAIRDHHICHEVLNHSTENNETTLLLLSLLKLAEFIANEDTKLLDEPSSIEWDAIKGPALDLLGLSQLDCDDFIDMIRNSTMA
jgi:HD-like signal output (HDOD) protein